MPDGSPGSAEVAVNMLDPDEGRVSVRESIDFSVERVTGERMEAASRTSIWPWLLGAGLLALLVEWWVYFRKGRLTCSEPPLRGPPAPARRFRGTPACAGHRCPGPLRARGRDAVR